MAILNIGSINWDRVYHVAHFPAPGETIAASRCSVGLGGKGLNQSVAIMRAGGTVVHMGAIGAGDTAMRAALGALGLGQEHVVALETCQTGSALILVDRAAENVIVLDRGANGHLPVAAMERAVGHMQPGDWVLVQNETNLLAQSIGAARIAGLRVALAAAPFAAASVVPLIDQIDLLAVNQVEFTQLCAAIGGQAHLPPQVSVLVTHGADGAAFLWPDGQINAPAFRVDAVDTTGAGDTFLGYFLAQLDGGATPQGAMQTALAAAAIQVSRPGAVDAIPYAAEIDAFLQGL